MNYAKLIAGNPRFAPNVVHWRESLVINPDAEKLTELGYKPVTYTEPQGVAPEGYVWRETWAETNEVIVRGWELTPESDLSPEETLAILLGGEGT